MRRSPRFSDSVSEAPSPSQPLYGLERYLTTPPRSAFPPASFTRRAASMICASLSTEHGPEMKQSSSPPHTTLPIATVW